LLTIKFISSVTGNLLNYKENADLEKQMTYPFSRALYTAKVIVDSLSIISRIDKQGQAYTPGELLEILARTCTAEIDYSGIIEPTDRLDKARGFQWELVKPLIYGGIVCLGDCSFTVDPSLTNPHGHDYHTYLVQDEVKKLPRWITNMWPREYVDFLQGVETFESLSRRMMEVLRDVDLGNDPHLSYLISTHGALMGFLSYVYSRQFREEIKPGEIITLEKRNGQLLVVGTGPLVHANDRYVDIFEEFNDYFK